jgi:hypothetical protein
LAGESSSGAYLGGGADKMEAPKNALLRKHNHKTEAPSKKSFLSSTVFCGGARGGIFFSKKVPLASIPPNQPRARRPFDRRALGDYLLLGVNFLLGVNGFLSLAGLKN